MLLTLSDRLALVEAEQAAASSQVPLPSMHHGPEPDLLVMSERLQQLEQAAAGSGEVAAQLALLVSRLDAHQASTTTASLATQQSLADLTTRLEQAQQQAGEQTAQLRTQLAVCTTQCEALAIKLKPLEKERKQRASLAGGVETWLA